MRVDLLALLMEFDAKLDKHLGPIHPVRLEIRKLLEPRQVRESCGVERERDRLEIDSKAHRPIRPPQ